MKSKVRVRFKESDHLRHPKGTSRGGQFAVKGQQGNVVVRLKGGPGSGNFGHAGRPGQVGGSANLSASPTDSSERNAGKIEYAFEDMLDGEDWQYADDDQSATVKDSVVSELSDKSGVSYDDVNRFIKQWAISSNGNDMRSLGIQQDAANEFGVPLSEFTKGQIEKTTQKERLLPEETQRKLLRTMYDVTQGKLRDMGIGPDDEVTIYRGTGSQQAKSLKPGDVVEYTGNAIESWSLGSHKADEFGEVYLISRVKAKSILSTAITGFGCVSEGEVTVLGGKGMAQIENDLDDYFDDIDEDW